MPYAYEILDVFTDTPLTGNPLAVVHDADGLEAPAMQTIAAEFNLSETVFLARSAAGHMADARIFTPRRELPFAGHPAIGTAVALAARHGTAEVAFAIPAGLVRARVEGGRAAFDAPQLPTVFAEGLPAEPVAAALGLEVAAVGFAAMRTCHVGVGPGFTIVPVDGPQRLDAIALDLAGWGGAFAAGFEAAFVVAPDGPGRFRARMFAPRDGIMEDPATGSAAVAFAGLWAASERPGEGVHRLAIVQGVEMGRRSEIGLEVEIAGGLLARVRLSGAAVRIAEGMLLV